LQPPHFKGGGTECDQIAYYAFVYGAEVMSVKLVMPSLMVNGSGIFVLALISQK
jgi:hypothetical protein